MPFFNNMLREMLAKAVDATISVRYHTGDPGSAGTTNLLGSADLGTSAPQIQSGSTGWTLDASLGRATRVDALSFGNAVRNLNGISHISMVKSGVVIGTRQLVSAFNVSQGIPVTLEGNTLILNVTSVD